MNVRPDQRIVQVHVGFLDLFEDVHRQRHLAAEGETGDELGGEVKVGLEVVFVYDCVELFQLFQVCALEDI